MMSPTCTLYEIEYELLYLLDSLEGLAPEDDEMSLELDAAITRAVRAEIEKVDGISHMLAHFESQAELAAAESKRLQSRKKAFERSGERLELYVRRAMEIAGAKKLEGQTTTLSLRIAPPSVLISNFEAVPAQYKEIRTEVVINKDAVKKALRSGREVPGAELCDRNLYLVRR
jgi:phage host-nuclease inhibitor protein Gam